MNIIRRLGFLLVLLVVVSLGGRAYAQYAPIPNEPSGSGCPGDVTQCSAYKVRQDINNRFGGTVPIAPSYTTATITATGTIAPTVARVYCNGSGAITLTLPPALFGQSAIEVTNLTANVCTVQAAGSDTINGGTSIALSAQYQAVNLEVDAAGSWINKGFGGGSGTVTSVTVTVPAWLTATGNPITGAGTIAISGAPAFSNLSGNIAISQIAGGSGASSSTFLRGDNTWATPAGSGGTGNTPITLSGATPVASVNTGNTFDDFNNLVMSVNVTSFTLPGTTTPDGKYLTVNANQPASGGPYTLPTGSVSSPFTAAAGTTLVNTVPGGCPAIPTAASNGVIYKLYYHGGLATWEIFGCQTNPSQAAPANNPTTTTGDLIVNSGGVLVRLAAGAVDTFLQGQGAGVLPAYSTAIASCSGASNALTYNTSTHQFGCNTISSGGITAANNGLYTNGTTVGRANLDQDATGNFFLRDDLVNNVALSGTYFSGPYLYGLLQVAGTNTLGGTTSVPGHIGIWQLVDGAVSGDDVVMNLANSGNNIAALVGASATPYTYESRQQLLSVTTNGYSAIGLQDTAGFTTAGAFASNQGIWCDATNTTAAADWACHVQIYSGSLLESTLTTTTLADTNWHTWKFVVTSSNVTFYLDGTSLGSLTTNIPTTQLQPAWEEKTSAANANTLNIDAWSFVQ